MKIGFIGLGRMGFALASNLLRHKVDLIVYDLQPNPVAQLVDQGALPGRDILDVVSQADVVFGECQATCRL
jgi:4-hydroxybutyrate dehydrogenase/sulfolactaldehyde 3-reductase